MRWIIAVFAIQLLIAAALTWAAYHNRGAALSLGAFACAHLVDAHLLLWRRERERLDHKRIRV